MARLTSIVFLLTAVFTVAGEEWFFQSPFPDGSPIQGIFPLSSDTLVIIGYDGTISLSPDMGRTWEIRPRLFLGDGFQAAMFPFDRENIWFLMERNGSKYVSKINIFESVVDTIKIGKNTIRNIYMLSPDSGWIVGSSDLLMKTMNGGKTWESMPSGQSTSWYAAHFEDFNTGWIVGFDGKIAFTQNGKNWVLQSSKTTKQLNAVIFVSDSIGFAAGNKETILKTVNRGTTWTLKQIDTTKSIARIFYLDSTLIAVSGNGAIYRSTNLGEDWITVNDSAISNVESVLFTDSSTGYLSKTGDIAKTEDGGKTWNFLFKPVLNDYLRAVCAVDSNTAFAAGDSGVIVSTKDGGNSWTLHETGFTGNFFGIHFPTPTHGWAVGNSATIFHTSDGGETWEEQGNPFSSVYDFNAVKFINNDTGLVAGTKGALLRTTDGGKNWEILDNPSTSSTIVFNCIQMLNAQTAFLGASRGELYKTVNCGESWARKTISAPGGVTPIIEDQYILNVCFLDEQTGIVTTSNARFWYTKNGGSTWAYHSTPTTSYNSYVSASLDTFFILYGNSFIKTDKEFQAFSPIKNLGANLFAIDFSGNTGWAIGTIYGLSAATIMKIKLKEDIAVNSTVISRKKMTNNIRYKKELPFSIIPLSPDDKIFTLSGRLVRDLKRPGSPAVIKRVAPGVDEK